MPPQGKTFSEIWYHFTKEDGNGKCRHCKKKIKMSGKSTGNLKRHLKFKHPTIKLHRLKPTSSQGWSPNSEEMTEGNMVVTKQNRVISQIWNHFTKEDDKGKCQYCQEKVKISGSSTGNLIRHLKFKHPTIKLQRVKSRLSKVRSQNSEEMTEINTVITMINRYSSKIWNHFAKEDDIAKCRYCKKKIKIPGKSTGNLTRHLKLKHPTIELQHADPTLFQAPSPNREELTEDNTAVTMLISENSGPCYNISVVSNFDTSSLNLPFCSDQQPTSRLVEVVKPTPTSKNRQIDIQLLKMICKGCQSFSVVENEEFKKFVYLLYPSYSLPSSKTLSNRLLLSMHNELLAKITTLLNEAQAVCFTLEGWTSIKNVSFYALTANFVDTSSRLRSFLLECSEFGVKPSSENIATWIEKVAKNFYIDYKICAIVTDNTANMKAIVQKLNLTHIACFAHSLNLVVLSAIAESNQKLVDKARFIVQFFKQGSCALRTLVEVQVSLNKNGLKLKQNVPARWNSTLDMLQRLYSNKEPITITLALIDSDVSLLEETEWESMHHCIEILRIFEEVTKEISAEKDFPMSKTTVLSRVIVRSVKQYLDTNKMMPESVKLMGSKLLEGLASMFQEREGNELIAQCVLLDPRFKKQGFGDESEFTWAYQSLVQQINVISQSAVEETLTVQTSSGSSNKLLIWDEFDESVNKLQAKQDPTASELFVELNKYLNEPYLSRISDPLTWWQSRKFVYPTLYKMALTRLCIPAKSVPRESIFSTAGQLINENRNKLRSKKVTQILFFYCNSDLL